jgi:heptosyltransferase-2
VVVQTAFPGDVVLTLPVFQSLRRRFPGAWIAGVVTPAAAPLLENHPAVDEIVVFDKRRRDRGLAGLWRLAARLRSRDCDIAIVPHRSVRSAALTLLAGIPRRVGFTTSAGAFLFTERVVYRRDLHEIERNLSLLESAGVGDERDTVPRLYPGARDVQSVDTLLGSWTAVRGEQGAGRLVALAPGSVWATKRWPEEYYAALGRTLEADGFGVILVGGEEDRDLCTRIATNIPEGRALTAAGSLTLLQSAELLRRCRAVVSNDSAPMHLAVAVGTPVVAIYGPTVPAFGFVPRGPRDRVVEVEGLSCRPCSIHGGPSCPIGTFDCMLQVHPDQVVSVLRTITGNEG